jgi:hypothetical protein
MKQSKAMSFLESLLSIAIGFSVSLLAQIYVLPLLGVTIALHQNIEFALIMTVVSIVRQFGVRRLFEALHIRRPLTPFMAAVIAEVFRQAEVEGFDAIHDDSILHGNLARAGACYLATADRGPAFEEPPALWPWAWEFWKPRDLRRDLVRGCALGIAEGNKFDRQGRKRRS